MLDHFQPILRDISVPALLDLSANVAKRCALFEWYRAQNLLAGKELHDANVSEYCSLPPSKSTCSLISHREGIQFW